jgi:hypothetical protein
MKTSTLNTLLDRLIKSEKDNEVLRYKNVELNGRMQSLQSQVKQLKININLMRSGVDVEQGKEIEVDKK